jgi:APA family basic amino acid/polyamine antiporter
MPRPYRTVGYPVVPIVFILGVGYLVLSRLVNKPEESLKGLVIIVIGLPFYFYWKRRQKA